MTNVLVLGAGGRIARHVVAMLNDDDNVEQTLFARHTNRLGGVPANAHPVQGDVLDRARLDDAMRGQDLVYANLSGDLDEQARTIIQAMDAAGIRRLVFVTALGIYDEVPGAFGEWNRNQIGSMLGPYRAAADAIEASNLDYTILRPAWLTNTDEVDYELTHRDKPFQGTEVSRKSVAALVTDIIHHPTHHSRANIGINKPGSDGNRPTFM